MFLGIGFNMGKGFGSGGPTWILRGGVWSDSGVWQDSAVWED